MIEKLIYKRVTYANHAIPEFEVPSTNEELMDKINEIIDAINRIEGGNTKEL